MKHQHGRESAGMIFITRFMNSFLHQASFATGYWYYDRHRSVRLVILVGLAIDQIAQSGLSSLSVIYYSAQLFRIVKLENEIEELKEENRMYKQQFVIWQYNAYKHGMKEHQLNAQLTKIDRERTDGEKR
nr:hypothetical protein [Escherichia coli]